LHQYQSPLTETQKRGSTPSDVGNAGHDLGQDKCWGQKKCIATGYTNAHSKQLMLVHYPNATFQPSIIDCKLNSYHENIKNVHS
jgi:hypothetical protein